VVVALAEFDAMWSSLFPAEQARIIHLLVERVTITGEGIAVDLRTAGLAARRTNPCYLTVHGNPTTDPACRPRRHSDT